MLPEGLGAAPEVSQAAREGSDARVLPVLWRERIAFMEAQRKAAGLTTTELARAMGISAGTIAEYQAHRRGEFIGCAFVQRWLSACGCAVKVVGPGR